MTAQEDAADWLRRAIVAGQLRPGQRVPQEDVAERIGVSVAPVREALCQLEQEGQVTYRPRRGYVVTELRIADLEEIYGLRRLIEDDVARRALPELDVAAVEAAARECRDAAERGDVAAQLAANRRFHLGILAGGPHALRVIRQLWDSTEAYRALYYNLPAERIEAADAHDRIVAALQARDADRLVAELDAHRERALTVLREVLGSAAEPQPVREVRPGAPAAKRRLAERVADAR